MNPHSLDFTSPNHSPKTTPPKRRILGEIKNFIPTSPLINRFKNSPLPSPISPLAKTPLNIKSPMVISPLTSLASPLLNSPIIASHSPLTSKLKRSSKITKIFEDRTQFKMENKENEGFSNSCYTQESYSQESYSKESFNQPGYSKESYNQASYSKESYNQESFQKFDLEETARDFSFGERFQVNRQRKETWSSTKLDFTDAIPTKSFDNLVPEQTQELDDLQSLQDLEEQLDNDAFESCKYEIISTDSPNVISRGRSTSRKICSRNFEFGAPLADTEASTSFNRPATRMLNFDDEDFEFTSPAIKKSVSVKKSLKFNETPTKNETAKNETPTKNPLRHEKSDSSIGSMSSPASSKLSRIFTSESTTSMESGFISELEEPFLDIEDSSSPKIANFNDLLSGQIKENIITDKNFLKRPSLARSLSFQPESKVKVSLVSILECPSEEKRKREGDDERSCKRRRSDCKELERMQRPVLQRAFSENNASIKSALARSCVNSDLIGDYSGGYALPLASGDHDDLKSISCDTLAAVLRGHYHGTVPHYQIIDCRYPYEFQGGHIESAVNLFTPEQVQELVESSTGTKTVLIFHCEFSIERGPKLSRTLRSFDRSHNRQHYPSLAFPELYLLHGGYRAFHRAHPSLCSPTGYTPMLDPQHKELLRRHRSLKGRARLLL